MSVNAIVKVPAEEQLRKIDEAFEVEEPDASIDVADAEAPLVQDISTILMPILAVEEKLEAIALAQQTRDNSKEITKAMVGVAKLSVSGMIGWFGFVAIAVSAYMVGLLYGYVLLPENALLCLIGTVAFAAILGAVGKLVQALNSK